MTDEHPIERRETGRPWARGDARDPRWNWVEVTRFGDDPSNPSYVKGTCRHIELEPVSGVGTVAAPVYRCRTCDAYLQTVPPPSATR